MGRECSGMNQNKKIEDWLDANVWDGDKLSNCLPSQNKGHRAYFNPHDLAELVCECLESIENKEDEIPQPETLEDKIKAKWPDKEVEMLGHCKVNGWLGLGEEDGAREPHIYAQSYKAFYKYVYECEGRLYIDRTPTDYCENTGKTLQPIAVLFERGEG